MGKKKSKKRFFAELAFVVGTPLYLVNQFTLPFLETVSGIPPRERQKKIVEAMGTKDRLVRYTAGSAEDQALKYLKLAHAYTTKYLSIGSTASVGYGQHLQERRGDCSETTPYTYVNYLRLLRNADRMDLAPRVKMVSGSVSSPNQGGYHGWLEVRRDGKWTPFETTVNDLSDDVVIDPKSVDSLVSDKLVFDSVGWDYTPEVTTQTGSDGAVDREYFLGNILTSEGFFPRVIKKLW